MDTKTQIDAIAVKCFAIAMQNTLPASQIDETDVFRIVMTVKVDGEPKVLLVFGKLYPFYGDGQSYAVLNPSREVLECAQPKLSYEKSAFYGECDLMSYQFINTNGKTPAVTGGYSYKAKKQQPARTTMP